MRKNKFIYEFFKFALKSFTETSNDVGEFLSTLDHVLTPRPPSLYKGLVPAYPPNRKGLHNLKNRGLIKFGEKEVRFTAKGRVWFKKSYLKYLRESYPKWDKKWRVVIFDIPQELHNNRIRLRQRLKNIGFFSLQKSVLVLPYPCENEIAEICRKLKVADYVDVIVAESIGFNEKEIKKVFNLS